MEIRVLGPLEVVADGAPLTLGGPKQRALLGLLALRANELVVRERLIADLWGSAPPKSVSAELNVYLSRLRRLIGRNGAAIELVTRPSGYVLQVPEGGLDLHRLEAFVAQGRRETERGDAAAAAAAFKSALELWRGPTLADLGYERCFQQEIDRLEELRLSLLEDRIDAELVLGRHREVVGELQVLAAEQPYRERVRGQLMLALYRSGRQADALSAYREMQRLLAQLGAEPGRALRRLELAILRQDRGLDLGSPRSTTQAGRILREAEMHERFAAWLAQRGEPESPEWEEILRHHLERAFLLYDAAGREDATASLGMQTARWFARAGRRALAVSDLRTASAALARARSLAGRGTTLSRRLAPRFGESLLGAGDLVGAYAVLADAADAATGDAERGLRERALLLAGYARAHADPRERERLYTLAANALDFFEETGDEWGAARALLILADGATARTAEAVELAELALRRAEALGDGRLEAGSRSGLLKIHVLGSTPVAEVHATIRKDLAIAEQRGDRALAARLCMWLGHLEAARGRFGEARRLVAGARDTLLELGDELGATEHTTTAVRIELIAGAPLAAEREARMGMRTLAAMGEAGCAGTLAAMLAQALCQQGRAPEALELAEQARTAAYAGDPLEEVDWRAARVRSLIGLERLDEAIELGRAAVAASEGTDLLWCRATALAAVAGALSAAGRDEEARPLAHQARELLARKGDTASAPITTAVAALA